MDPVKFNIDKQRTRIEERKKQGLPPPPTAVINLDAYCEMSGYDWDEVGTSKVLRKLEHVDIER